MTHVLYVPLMFRNTSLVSYIPARFFFGHGPCAGHLCLVCPFIKEAILEIYIYRYRMESLEMSDLFLKIKPHTCSEKHSWNMHIYRMRHLIRLVHPGEGETTHFQGIPAARWFGWRGACQSRRSDRVFDLPFLKWKALLSRCDLVPCLWWSFLDLKPVQKLH